MPTANDLELAQKLIAKEILSRAEVQRHLDDIDEWRKEGKAASLEQVLFEQKILTAKEIIILKKKKRILHCSKCQSMYHASDEDIGSRFKCKQCGTVVVVPAPGQTQKIAVKDLKIHRGRKKKKDDEAEVDSHKTISGNVEKVQVETGKESIAADQEPGAMGQEPRATSQEPGATSHEPEATSQEPRATSQEPGATSHEQEFVPMTIEAEPEVIPMTIEAEAEVVPMTIEAEAEVASMTIEAEPEQEVVPMTIEAEAEVASMTIEAEPEQEVVPMTIEAEAEVASMTIEAEAEAEVASMTIEAEAEQEVVPMTIEAEAEQEVVPMTIEAEAEQEVVPMTIEAEQEVVPMTIEAEPEVVPIEAEPEVPFDDLDVESVMTIESEPEVQPMMIDVSPAIAADLAPEVIAPISKLVQVREITRKVDPVHGKMAQTPPLIMDVDSDSPFEDNAIWWLNLDKEEKNKICKMERASSSEEKIAVDYLSDLEKASFDQWISEDSEGM